MNDEAWESPGEPEFHPEWEEIDDNQPLDEIPLWIYGMWGLMFLGCCGGGGLAAGSLAFLGGLGILEIGVPLGCGGVLFAIGATALAIYQVNQTRKAREAREDRAPGV
ncbi:MAG: hypothetical protein GYB68_16390 [Chloroflexi bacterium]|nr:hypothetical protein [Chloroflexota bacterium]